MGAASMPKSWVPSRGSAPYSWWVTVLLLQHPYRFLLDRVENDAIRTRGLGLLKQRLVPPNGARKGLEFLG
ncbi:hypothetical protein [Pseudomonas protegens]|uniref:hypothetical protein n=1 Tax=Pseudomonas protegens TaxID=380021 RepID=UPI0011873505|nr:hypothetical protein [Pseudomonas protegens]